MASPEEVFGGIGIVPGKDIEPGMFVAAVEHVKAEDDDKPSAWKPNQQASRATGMPVLVQMPDEDDELKSIPLYVAHVSFPLAAFVVVPDGRRVVRDLREFQFVRVDPGFARFMVHEEYYQKRYPDLFKSGKVDGNIDLIKRSARVSEAKGHEITEALSIKDKEEDDGQS